MTEALQQEIRTLKNIFESERDPEGRVFAPLADAFRRAGEIPQAVRLLNEGRARHPQFVPGHVVAAQLYAEQGLVEEATIAARNALALDGDNVNALRSLLRVLEERGDPEVDEVRPRLVALDPLFAGGEEPEAIPRRSRFEEEPAASTVDTQPEAMELSGQARAVDPADWGGDGDSTGIDTVRLDLVQAPEGGGDAFDLSEEPVIDLDSLSLVGVEDEVEEVAAVVGLGPELLDELTVEEPVIDLDALAPVRADEDVADPMDLADVASDWDVELPTEEPVLDLDTLAPVDSDRDGDVVSLLDLAPEPEEDVVALADLAPEPEEDVVALADLAPEPEEDVVALADLAPEPDEDVIALADLAPEPEQDVIALADLAPEPEEDETVALADLAPEVEPEEEVMDLAALAPEPQAEEAVMDVAELVPPIEADPDDVTVMDLSALAPESEPEPEPVLDLEDLAPDDAPDEAADAGDDVVIDLDALKPAPAPEGGVPEGDDGLGEPVYTRTLAELYVKQGAIDQAVEVLRHVSASNPDDVEVARRLHELESGAVPDDEPAGAEPPDEEVETLARELAEGGHGEHDMASPFHWPGDADGDGEGEDTESGATIGDYFDGLLTWKPGAKP